MKPLIDADIFLYEIGSVGQYKDETTNEIVYRDFDQLAESLDRRVEEICNSVGASEPPTLFLTGTRQYWGDSFIPNFREELSKHRVYKGKRKTDKPFHYFNLYHYIIGRYDTIISNGCEADDLLGIEQYSNLNTNKTIICTRDKDLRMIPGYHYGWECYRQPEFEPYYYTDIGELKYVSRQDKNGKPAGGKLTGGGKAFFFAQLLTGDAVDNISGLDKVGPSKAYELLFGAKTEEDYLDIVKQSYRDTLGKEDWLQALQEQADLLWICRELNEDGSIKRYVVE